MFIGGGHRTGPGEAANVTVAPLRTRGCPSLDRQPRTAADTISIIRNVAERTKAANTTARAARVLINAD